MGGKRKKHAPPIDDYESDDESKSSESKSSESSHGDEESNHTVDYPAHISDDNADDTGM